jgi:hypothetical protein
VSTAYAPEDWKEPAVAVALTLGAVVNAWVLLIEILR